MNTEREVRAALAKYKVERIGVRYRSWWYLLRCLRRGKAADRLDVAQVKAEAGVRAVVNQSAKHQNWLRIIVSQQPDHVRAEDNFLSLLN